jgi:hypothetical protein
MGEAQLSFLELSDTPYDYVGQADKSVLVASDESGLVFGTASGGGGGPVNGGDIIAGSIPGSAIVPGGIGPIQIADGGVGTAELAPGAVTPDKMDPYALQIGVIRDMALTPLGTAITSTMGFKDIASIGVKIDSYVKGLAIDGYVSAWMKTSKLKGTASIQFGYRWGPETATGTTAVGNPTITALSIDPVAKGWTFGTVITGTGIPAGSFIMTATTNSITLNQNATVSNSGVTITAQGGSVLPVWPAIAAISTTSTKTPKAAVPKAAIISLRLTGAEIQAIAGVHSSGNIVMQIKASAVNAKAKTGAATIYRVPYALTGILPRI